MNSTGKTGGLIFSRFDSTRLPGKALLEINGREMLGRVIDRAKKIPGLDGIVVATTDREVDDPIAEFASNENVGCFRGSLDDVAFRAFKACESFGFSKFVRICGDRPFFEPEVVVKLLTLFSATTDVATTSFPRTYPPGLTGEVVSFEALARVIEVSTSPEDREHVTRYFYQHAESFNIVSLPTPDGYNFDGVRLVVDDQEDLQRAQWIAKGVDKQGAYIGDMGLVLEFAREWDARNKL